MFGSGKKKQYAELMAPQWVKILNDSNDLINKTVKAEIFFSRYDMLKEMAANLASISKYVKFKGMKPAEILRKAEKHEAAATRDFILRCYSRALMNAEKVKTEKGKRSQFEKFQAELEPYYFRMSDDNAALVQRLHDEALEKMGG